WSKRNHPLEFSREKRGCGTNGTTFRDKRRRNSPVWTINRENGSDGSVGSILCEATDGSNQTVRSVQGPVREEAPRRHFGMDAGTLQFRAGPELKEVIEEQLRGLYVIGQKQHEPVPLPERREERRKIKPSLFPLLEKPNAGQSSEG